MNDKLSLTLSWHNIYVKAIVIFAAIYGLYTFFLIDSKLYLLYLESMHSSTSALLNWIGLDHQAKFNHYLRAGSLKTDLWAEVSVDSRTDAILEITILIAAISAWSSRLTPKILYITAGLFIFYGLAILRITAAMLVDQYAPLRYEIIATWVLPIALIVLVLLYFYIWTLIALRFDKPSN